MTTTEKMVTQETIFRVPEDFVPTSDHPTESTEPYYQRIIWCLKRVLHAQGVTITIRHTENLPATGGALIALNHTSYLDFIFGGVAACLRGGRLVRFMAKKEIFAIPVIGRMMTKMRHISVDRAHGRGSLNEAIARLKAGEIVGIFPESTISRSLTIRPTIKTGAARIAAGAGVPLIPATMVGAQRMWTKDHKKRLGRTNTPVLIHIGTPIEVTGDPEVDTRVLRDKLSEMLAETWADYKELFGPFEGSPWWMPAAFGGSAPTQEVADERDADELERRRAKKAKKADARLERKAQKALNALNPAKTRLTDFVENLKARLTKK